VSTSFCCLCLLSKFQHAVHLHTSLTPQMAHRGQDVCFCRGKMGKAPDPAPRWAGNIIAKLLTAIGPKGLEFGRYSIDYHYIRNYIHVNRHWKADRAKQHIPQFATKLVDMYNQTGSVDDR